jgi:ABC-type nitrate/sulfonate/bicarbonate transport system ATPase subunit
VERDVPALELRGIAFAYPLLAGLLPVLAGVSLAVPPGGWATLIGPSGCGKTTLLKVAAGLLRPAEGEVLLAGQPVDPLGKVTYMPQADTLLPWRDALGNAILAAEVDGRSRAAARAEARDLFHRFGLAGFEEAYPHELSGGMRQRLALIRTFMSHRDVLLLDEPLGALDALTRAALQEWLAEVWETLGKTVLFVTHDVEEAVLLSDRIYVLSPRPARVVAVLPVDLPRPRDRTSGELAGVKAQVLTHLESDG